MKKLLFFLIMFSTAQGATLIPVPVPEEAIRVYIENKLPVNLMENNPDFKGDLKVTNIDNLSIQKGKIIFNVFLRGKNISYKKNEKNFVVKIEIKKLHISFFVEAKTEFDRKKRVLRVVPRITRKKVVSDNKRVEDHILQLLSLINNKEYMVPPESIEPVFEDILGRRLKMKIDNIRTAEKIIFLDMDLDLGGLFK